MQLASRRAAALGPAPGGAAELFAPDEPEGAVMSQVLPASFAQERLWFFTQMQPDLGVYNIGFPVPLPAGVDRELLRAALGRLVDRHETMRTALAYRDGQLVQIVHDTVEIEITETSLLDLPADEIEWSTRRLLTSDCAEPFNLERAPLWRGRLIRRPDRWLLSFVVHHAVFDANSVSNLIAELVELCRAAGQGRSPQLPDLPIQY